MAEGWFHQRAAGVAQNWVSFVAQQQQEQLPANWDPDRRNLVFFCSSEDEFVSISDRGPTPLFPTQVEAMRAILASLENDPPQDTHLYLRMHPNLKDADNLQKRELESLESPFLTVIGPEDPTSTYAMMRGANMAIGVGSTAGLEAVYWGTPSVLIGPAFYQDLGATYNPETPAEFMDLLRADLTPKNNEPALMVAHYAATYGQPFQHFEATGFLDGRFRGTLLSKTSASRFKVWLLDQPSGIRSKLAQLTSAKPPKATTTAQVCPTLPKKAA